MFFAVDALALALKEERAMYLVFHAMPSKSGREPILPALGLARLRPRG
jgi:hypothetical protein